jgi:transketolase
MIGNLEKTIYIDPGIVLKETDIPKKVKLLKILTQQFRIDVFDMIRKRQNGHWGGSSSAAELLTVLYYHIMNVRPGEPDWKDRDRLVLSKGHAAPFLYTVLAHRGFYDLSVLEKFRALNSPLQGHPCMNKTHGVDMSTGALGHGTSVSLGMSLAARYLKKQFRTFLIIGDGDLNEGQTWEAFMSIAKFKPPRLHILIDYNKVQLDGTADEIMPLDVLEDKISAFNLNVAMRHYNGHSVEDILASWEWMKQHENYPTVVIYDTVKGKSVSFMEGNHKWHGSPIDDQSYESGRKELVDKLNKLVKE